MTFDPDLYLQEKSASQEFNPDDYLSSKKSLLEKAKDVGAGALHAAGQVIEHLGPGQVKNFTAQLLGQREPNLSDMITGSNAPGMGEILNKENFPSFDIVLGANSENLQDFQTTPRLSDQERTNLKKVPTGYNSNDVLGALVDFRLGDVGVNNAIKAVKVVAPVVKSGASAITSKFGTKSALDATQEQSAVAEAAASAKQRASIEGGQTDVEVSGSPLKAKTPQSLKEIEDMTIPDAEMVQKTRLKQIENVVPDMQLKPLKYHYDMLENPKSMKELKAKFENLPSSTSKKLAQYDLGMLQETQKSAEDVIKGLSSQPVKSIDDAGEHFIQQIGEKYVKTQDELKPAFKALKDNSVVLSKVQSQDIIRKISENTKVGNLLKEEMVPILKDGKQVGTELKLSLGANKPRYGVSGEEYSAIKSVIDDLNDGVNFEEVQKIREFLRKAKNTLNPEATAEIERVRKTLLSSLEDMTPGDVQPVFKQYAVNEQNLQNVEKIIGGKIEDLSSMYRANPDKVVGKIFSNPNYTKVIEQYAGKQVIDDMMASYLNKGLQGSIDSTTGFSPVKFRQWLKTNGQFIRNYVDPQVADKLQALGDRGYLIKRFMDDVNPSGTAMALKEMFDVGNVVTKIRQGGIKGFIEGEVAAKTIGAVRQKQAIKAVNEAMGETTQAAPKTSLDLSKYKNALPEAKDVGRFAVGFNTANKLPKSAENQEQPQAKWIDNGLKKINQVSELHISSNDFKNDPSVKELLIKASNMPDGSPKLKDILEQIRNTDAFKKAPKSGPKTSQKYPITLKKNGHQVTVSDDQDYYEAKSEGWL